MQAPSENKWIKSIKTRYNELLQDRKYSQFTLLSWLVDRPSTDKHAHNPSKSGQEGVVTPQSTWVQDRET